MHSPTLLSGGDATQQQQQQPQQSNNHSVSSASTGGQMLMNGNGTGGGDGGANENGGGHALSPNLVGAGGGQVGAAPLCIRVGCTNQAVSNSDWEDEYCSNECVITHCRCVLLVPSASLFLCTLIFKKQAMFSN